MKFAEKLAKLLDVKSLVTLTLTSAFTYMAIRGTIQADQFLTIFTVVIGFYFGVQIEKHRGGGDAQ